ncbi:MAG: PepSY domain-containing protein [Magnetococcales bacterium]|nr:PepSY domain-containing protein [Magnetococcales bacterium]
MGPIKISIAVFIVFVWTGVIADADTQKMGLAVESDGIIGLEMVLVQARQQFPGRILKVELENDEDALSGSIYEVKILKRDGSVIEVEYDAKTLKVLDVKGDDWQNRQLPK